MHAYTVDLPRLQTPPTRTTLPRPFLKWVGGKRQLLPELVDRLPRRFGVYHEPFLGGGALFFHLRPRMAVIADVNLRLVRTYRAVRDRVEDVLEMLRRYPHDKEFFLQLRDSDIDSRDDVEVAAWFIYLNRTGFNGLYRVNRRNRFNVPFGRYKSPNFYDPPLLRAASRVLQGAAIVHQPFDCVVEQARPGDFVYFDPPYVPLNRTSSFTSYARTGFTLDDQARLRDVALTLKGNGVRVLLSNSSAPQVHTLYSRGFTREEVWARRNINCDAGKRKGVAELLIS